MLHAFCEFPHRWGRLHDIMSVVLFERETPGFEYGQVPSARCKKVCFLCVRMVVIGKGVQLPDARFVTVIGIGVQDVFFPIDQNCNDAWRSNHPDQNVFGQDLLFWRKMSQHG